MISMVAKWYNKNVQKIQNKNVQMLYCYRGGKQYDHKQQHFNIDIYNKS